MSSLCVVIGVLCVAHKVSSISVCDGEDMDSIPKFCTMERFISESVLDLKNQFRFGHGASFYCFDMDG